jgi:putative hemolysin
LLQRAERGDRRARIALDLTEAQGQFLSTVQIWITLIGILAGAFSGATIADELAEILNRSSAVQGFGEVIAVAAVVMVVSFLSLVFGELVPKRIALENPEQIASMVAPGMRFVSHLAGPIVRLVHGSTELILRMLRIRPSESKGVTSHDIAILMRQGLQEGEFEPAEREMVERVLRLHTMGVTAVMTPRPAVVWLKAGEEGETLHARVSESRYSCFPLAEGNLDNVLGLVFVKDLLAQTLAGEAPDPLAVLRPPLFVFEHLSVLEVLQRFRETRSHVALVIDEFGGVQGLVTINDILGIVLSDTAGVGKREQPRVVRRADGGWEVDGSLPFLDVADVLQFPAGGGAGKLPYQTVGGMMMTLLERVPEVGDVVEAFAHRFEVLSMEGRRVGRVHVRRSREAETGGDDA